MSHNQDHLAYGQYHGQDSDRAGTGDSARSLVGDAFGMLKNKYKTHQGSHSSGPAPGNQNQPPSQSYNPSGYGVSRALSTLSNIIKLVMNKTID